MSGNALFWLLLWIGSVSVAAWTLPRQWFPWLQVAAVSSFLAVYSPWSAAALVACTAVVLAAVRWREHSLALILAITSLVAGFAAYRLFAPRSEDELGTALLLGFAFYSLRAIHLVCDLYFRRQKHVDMADVVGWLWFLPTFIVGPINRFDAWQREMSRRRFDIEQFSKGAERILIGYFKIVVVGGYVVEEKLGNLVLAVGSDTWLGHALDTFFYALELYIKFSGFSDIAIGFAALLGIGIAENFRYPFLATSIQDFWQRWHISLSQWCRDYVYMPLFARYRVQGIAAIGSMLVLGLWHDLSVNYLLWGLWHGAGVAVWQAWNRTDIARGLNSGNARRLWRPFARALTLLFVILSFVFTSTESLAQAIDRWRILLGLGVDE